MTQLLRKINRLTDWDYSKAGTYFITICTNDKQCLFGKVLDSHDEPLQLKTLLSQYGLVIEKAIINIPKYYPDTYVDNYVIMPNHIHLLIRLSYDRKQSVTISTIINQMKGYVTKQIGEPICQKLF